MILTLHEHLIAGGNWPAELDRVDRQGYTLAVCTCGRTRTPDSFVFLKPANVPVADRLPGQIRRSRMTKDRRDYAQRTARLREPEVSPEWACVMCVGAMRILMGIEQDELDRRLGK